MRLVSVLILLIAVVACVSASDSEFILPVATYVSMFKSFITKFRRSFSAANFAKKLEVFKKNVDRITNLNKGSRVKYGMNNLADVSSTEYMSMLGTSKSGAAALIEAATDAEAEADSELYAEVNAENPASFDWTNNGGKNYLQAIQHQGQCGSCWAFTAIACLEAQLTIKLGVSMKLSEQALISCAGVGACRGGAYYNAFKAIKEGKTRLAQGSSYPYRAAPTPDICSKVGADKSVPGKVTKYQLVRNSDSAFMSAVTKTPIGVSIDASQMQFYKSGIIPHTNCSRGVNHGVVLVGYGENSEGKYWKIRNSYGEDWGMNGYFYIARDGQNTCSMRSDGAFPTMGK